MYKQEVMEVSTEEQRLYQLTNTFVMIVSSPPILETGLGRFSTFVGIGFVINISSLDRRHLVSGYHPIYIVEFLLLMKPQKHQDQNISKRGIISYLVSDVFLKRCLYLKASNLTSLFCIIFL